MEIFPMQTNDKITDIRVLKTYCYQQFITFELQSLLAIFWNYAFVQAVKMHSGYKRNFSYSPP